ncbi:MAG: HdeD family acid-resistance protein, partial [Acidimicrobiales bacterium]
SHRWLYVVAGVVSIGAGIIGLVWPGITLLVLAVIIGWTLLFWGVADLVQSLSNRKTVQFWWAILIRGVVSILLGIWALRHPGDALLVFVAVIGIWSVVFGIIEVIGAFEMRHAREQWEALKAKGAV